LRVEAGWLLRSAIEIILGTPHKSKTKEGQWANLLIPEALGGDGVGASKALGSRFFCALLRSGKLWSDFLRNPRLGRPYPECCMD
jgi:hypothetical protein